MIMIKVHKTAAGSLDELFGELKEALSTVEKDNLDLLSLDSRPRRRHHCSCPREKRRPSTESLLLTTRRDLLQARKALLDGHVRLALHDVDYLIDQIDNILGEM